ncbi:hypothetical protein ACD661_16110 [Legionella lytica]|uniref:Histidine kinase n=1 Tax=Legionella lytica TaxID=96232 RepID=A0ABW8DBK2_9GAMM
MNLEEKNKIIHDVTNSFVVIKSISKSASNFVNKVLENNNSISNDQVDLFKKAMLSLQKEISKIEIMFHGNFDKW